MTPPTGKRWKRVPHMRGWYDAVANCAFRETSGGFEPATGKCRIIMERDYQAFVRAARLAGGRR